MHFKPKAQQRHRLAWQQLSDDQLQGLAPAVVAAGKKLQDMAAIAEPALLGVTTALAVTLVPWPVQATSGAHPCCRTRSSVHPWQRLAR